MHKLLHHYPVYIQFRWFPFSPEIDKRLLRSGCCLYWLLLYWESFCLCRCRHSASVVGIVLSHVEARVSGFGGLYQFLNWLNQFLHFERYVVASSSCVLFEAVDLSLLFLKQRLVACSDCLINSLLCLNCL